MLQTDRPTRASRAALAARAVESTQEMPTDHAASARHGRPTVRADRAGVANLIALVRTVRLCALPAYAVPTGHDGLDPRVDESDASWMLQASHGETAEARPGRAQLAFQRTDVRGTHVDETEDTAETTRIVALVELAKKGDAEAFGQLYDHYVSTIYRYIYYRVGTHVLAEDLTSETFLRALRALSSFRWQGRDFGAWLVTIARNLVTDHFKSGRFRLEVATGEILDYDSASDGPEDDVLSRLTNEALVTALKKLGSEQQECLVLRFLNGLSVAETAKVLSKSEGAVKQLQLRAVRNLAKLLPDGIR